MDSELNSRIELVLAAPLATRGELERLCQEARANQYRAVVVPSGAILLAEHFLAEAPVKICCRIGCASGSMDPDAKRYETELAIDAGAHEIELVPSLARIQEGELAAVLREIRDITEAADERPVRIALEPASWDGGLLNELVQMVLDSGAHYLCGSQKNATGLDEIERLRGLCGPDFGIIARIDSAAEASSAFSAGANFAALRL